MLSSCTLPDKNDEVNCIIDSAKYEVNVIRQLKIFVFIFVQFGW